MARSWTKAEAFDHFGVELENVRWSWSGVSPDGTTVALVLCQDGIKRKDGEFCYRDDEELDAEWRTRIGAKRRVEHLKQCMMVGGRFRAIIAKAIDVTADPRSIEKCFPQTDVYWELDQFDQDTGAFTALIVQA